MKLISLNVTKVFGYLNFGARFRKDLTFLTGINGSGKTTALRLIQAVLTPSLRELDRILFESITVELKIDGKRVVIQCVANDEAITLTVSNIAKQLTFPRADPRQIQDRNRPEERLEEHYSIMEDRYSTEPVMMFLRNDVATPIFLGLERKNAVLSSPSPAETMNLIERERLLRMGRHIRVGGMLGSGLTDIQFMLQANFRRMREEQDKFQAELRNNILLSAFDYSPISEIFMTPKARAAMKVDISKQIKNKRPQIELAMQNLGVDRQKFDPVIKTFFDRVDRLAMSRPTKGEKSGDGEINELFELALNRPLIDRVIKLVELFETYTAKVDALMKPTQEYLTLANRFLQDSDKELIVDQVGRLVVRLKNGEERSIDALSSGERQIVVILGYLAINHDSNKEEVFIVDEPELSLHLRWQEIFVDSILEASPGHQFILATHSPAIVLERTKHCVEIRSK